MESSERRSVELGAKRSVDAPGLRAPIRSARNPGYLHRPSRIKLLPYVSLYPRTRASGYSDETIGGRRGMTQMREVFLIFAYDTRISYACIALIVTFIAQRVAYLYSVNESRFARYCKLRSIVSEINRVDENNSEVES